MYLSIANHAGFDEFEEDSGRCIEPAFQVIRDEGRRHSMLP
jgi:hypothetical protein